MTKLTTVLATVTLVVALAACSKSDSKENNDPSSGDDHAEKASAEHAPANVVPGSHEDWCGEHAVPESQCTRCNPELVAAFKATGDWCEEHGLPESQCLTCNPDIEIVRPPPAGGDKIGE